ncbi:MAG: lytic transglycosylase domain-containing protein [Bacteroidales bacterium]|nr:lytic transglycosylase domain-containing protein [Bacteroidales bacterium]
MVRRKFVYFIAAIVIVGIAGVFIFGIADKQDPERDYRGAFRRNYMIFTPELPEKVDFAGEKVPLNDLIVRESFDREILAFTFMHSTTQQMFKRAHRYFPVIEPILKKYKVPDDFKFLAIAESNLGDVTSPAGAEGVWQFLISTGRKYGLEVNNEIDERYNLIKATVAACQYLLEAHDSFGDWTLAAASYNRGINGLDRALKGQKVNSYYDLYLNEETARYIFRILAAKEVYENPTKYGFFLKESDFYPEIKTYTIVVDTTITDLPAFAKSRGITYRIIREFNPWIHGYSLPNKSRKTYILTLPEKDALSVTSYTGRKTSETFFHDTLKINEIR